MQRMPGRGSPYVDEERDSVKGHTYAGRRGHLLFLSAIVSSPGLGTDTLVFFGKPDRFSRQNTGHSVKFELKIKQQQNKHFFLYRYIPNIA